MKKLLVILLLPLSLYSQTRQSTIDSCRAIMFKLVNDHRIEHGVHPLVHNDSAQKLAQIWAEHLYKENELYHSNFPGGENCSGTRASDVDLFFNLFDDVFAPFRSL